MTDDKRKNDNFKISEETLTAAREHRMMMEKLAERMGDAPYRVKNDRLEIMNAKGEWVECAY